MSESGEVEVAVAAYPVLPKEVVDEIGSIKLFNKWSYEDVEVKDISLTYGNLSEGAGNWADGFDLAAITCKSGHPSTSLTLPVAMPPSGSARRSAPSSSA